MAILSSGSFAAASSKIAGTTLTFTSSQNLLKDDLAVLFVAADNSAAGTATNFVTSVRDNAINQNFLQGFGFTNTVRTIVTQSDGKILVGGNFLYYNRPRISNIDLEETASFNDYPNSDTEANYIARLNSDGTLDTSFKPSVSDFISAIAIQPNVTGSFSDGVWSTSALMASPGFWYLGGTGTQNAALSVAGQNNSNIFGTTQTYEYDGTSWAANVSMGAPLRRGVVAVGTQNEALAFGGGCNITLDNTNEYDGTSWTAGGALITARGFGGGAGTQNAALAFGGASTTPTYYDCTEEYNGTSWSSAAGIDGGRIGAGYQLLAGTGTQNAAFAIGGNCTNPCYCLNEVCTYDGTTWYVNSFLNVNRAGLAASGVQNDSLAVGGFSKCQYDTLSCTEEYNGTSWVSGQGLIYKRAGLAAAGNQNAGLAFGGYAGNLAPTPVTNFLCELRYTEEYNKSTPGYVTCISDKIVVLGKNSSYVCRFNPDGSQDASFTGVIITNSNNFDGPYSILIQETNSYGINNKVWSIATPMVKPRCSLAGTGTQNVALAAGGYDQNTAVNNTEEYDGNSWIISNPINITRSGLAGAGTQNAGLAFGGQNSNICACTEEYDGTSWTAGGNLIIARSNLAGAGTQNEALAFGGCRFSPLLEYNCTEEYNGTSWAAGNLLNQARSTLAGAGTQNEALAFGGVSGSILACTEEYDGTTWTAGGNLIIARYNLAGAGTQNAGLAFGGEGSFLSYACTEEYDGTTWTAGGSLNFSSTDKRAGAGTQNEALAFGGDFFNTLSTEEYNLNLDTTTCYFNKIIIAGGFGTYNYRQGSQVSIARINAGGDYDHSFDIGQGFYSSDGDPIVNDIKFYNFQNTSSILAVGRFSNYYASPFPAGGSGSRNNIALINADNGSLIPTSSFNIGAGFNAVVNSIDVQSDNKIVAVGAFTTYSGSNATRIARINTTGLIDSGSTFNTGAGLNNTGSIVKFYTSGSTNVILVGGIFTTYSGSTQSGSVRILSSGSRDTNFNIGSGFGSATDVRNYLIQSDGKIIAVGGFKTYSASFFPSPNYIVNLNSNGSVNASQIGNTWAKISERSSNDAAGAGSTLALFHLTSSYDIIAGTSITASFTASITAKAATGWAFHIDSSRLIAYTGSVTSSAAGGTSQPVRINLANLTSGSGEFLFVRGVAFENDTATVFTPTTNYTTMTAAGTAGGAAITNQSVRGEFRILTTASYFSNPTLSVAASQASIFWTFYEFRNKTYYILLD